MFESAEFMCGLSFFLQIGTKLFHGVGRIIEFRSEGGWGMIELIK